MRYKFISYLIWFLSCYCWSLGQGNNNYANSSTVTSTTPQTTSPAGNPALSNYMTKKFLEKLTLELIIIIVIPTLAITAICIVCVVIGVRKTRNSGRKWWKMPGNGRQPTASQLENADPQTLV